jgi:hypothetical protein
MKLTTHKSNIRTIRQDSPDFRMVDGFTVVPRAGFEISQSCPAEYKSIFITAINIFGGFVVTQRMLRMYKK